MTDPINPDHYRRFPVEVIEQAKADARDEGQEAGMSNYSDGRNGDGRHQIANPYRKAIDD